MVVLRCNQFSPSTPSIQLTAMYLIIIFTGCEILNDIILLISFAKIDKCIILFSDT